LVPQDQITLLHGTRFLKYGKQLPVVPKSR